MPNDNDAIIKRILAPFIDLDRGAAGSIHKDEAISVYHELNSFIKSHQLGDLQRRVSLDEFNSVCKEIESYINMRYERHPDDKEKALAALKLAKGSVLQYFRAGGQWISPELGISPVALMVDLWKMSGTKRGKDAMISAFWENASEDAMGGCAEGMANRCLQIAARECLLDSDLQEEVFLQKPVFLSEDESVEQSTMVNRVLEQYFNKDDVKPDYWSEVLSYIRQNLPDKEYPGLLRSVEKVLHYNGRDKIDQHYYARLLAIERYHGKNNPNSPLVCIQWAINQLDAAHQSSNEVEGSSSSIKGRHT